MALDTSVLQFQPVAQADPLGVAAKFQNLQNLAQQKQINQQQLQSGALELQDRQRQLDQTTAINEAYKNALVPGANGAAPSFDSDKLQNALALGGHGAAIPGVMKGINENAKAAADLATARTKVATDQADFGGSVGATVKAAGYDPNVLLAQATHALAAKALDPGVVTPIIQELQQAQQADAQNGTQTARALTQQLADHLIAASPAQQKLSNETLAAQGAAARGTAATGELALNTKKADAAEADKAIKTALTNYALAAPEQKAAALAALPPDLQAKVKGLGDNAVLQMGMTPAEIAADRRGKATAANTQAYQGVELSLQRARLAVEQARANREAGLGTSTPFEDLPAALKPTALALSRGDIGFQALSRYPPKDRELITAGAFEKNGSLSQALYDTKQDFKTKGDADKIGSITRIMGHIASYKANSQAEGFSPGAAVGVSTEANTPTATDARAITDEFGYLVKHGALNEGEAKEYKQELNSSRPGIRSQAINELETLMKSQFEATYQKYKTGSGGTVFPAHEFFDKKTMNLLQQQNALPEGYVEPAAPGAAAPPAAPAKPNAGLQHMSTDDLLKQLGK
jgi:polyhydroxyalkanoate synthesis regulator phasin